MRFPWQAFCAARGLLKRIEPEFGFQGQFSEGGAAQTCRVGMGRDARTSPGALHAIRDQLLPDAIGSLSAVYTPGRNWLSRESRTTK